MRVACVILKVVSGPSIFINYDTTARPLRNILCAVGGGAELRGDQL